MVYHLFYMFVRRGSRCSGSISAAWASQGIYDHGQGELRDAPPRSTGCRATSRTAAAAGSPATRRRLDRHAAPDARPEIDGFIGVARPPTCTTSFPGPLRRRADRPRRQRRVVPPDRSSRLVQKLRSRRHKIDLEVIRKPNISAAATWTSWPRARRLSRQRLQVRPATAVAGARWRRLPMSRYRSEFVRAWSSAAPSTRRPTWTSWTAGPRARSPPTSASTAPQTACTSAIWSASCSCACSADRPPADRGDRRRHHQGRRPSGKDERQLLDEDRSRATSASVGARRISGIRRRPTGAAGQQRQLAVEIRYIEFLREYGRHFTINRMLTFEFVNCGWSASSG